jgi:hypothetical protein
MKLHLDESIFSRIRDELLILEIVTILFQGEGLELYAELVGDLEFEV